MTNKIKYSYALILLMSLLIYTMPVQQNENGLSIGITIVTILLTGILSRWIWNAVKQTERVTFLLWILNSIALFHLVLIFIFLVIKPIFILLPGGIYGILTYLTVFHSLKNRI